MALTHSRSRGNVISGYLFLAPSTILLLVVVVFPILYVIFLGFSKFYYGQRTGFNGLNNYLTILTDPNFYTSLKATVVFTLGSVVGQVLLAIVFAVVINSSKKAEGGIRLFVILPYMVSMVAVGVTFKWMLNAEFGIVNFLLLSTGLIRQPINFLGDTKFAMASLVTAHIWASAPFATLILLAGIKSISSDIYESAEIDGAGFFRRFFSITLPLIRQQILIVMLIQTMYSFRHFPLPYSMTGGGPGMTTKLLAVLLKEKMSYLDYGYNSGLSVIMMVITLVIAWFYLEIMSKLKI